MQRNTGGGLAVLLGGTAALLLLTGCYLWWLGSHGLGTPRLGGAWTLTRGDGQVVSDRDYRGRYLLVYFGYTACPDVCPTTLAAVQGAMHALGPRADQLQPLFISIDPTRDTPDVVQRYVDAFGPGLVGLTGTTAQIRLVQQEYRVRSTLRHGPGREDYALDHSAALLLVGPDGRYLAPFPADETPDQIVAQLARYLG
ncbi:MAG: SCO family protein [Janthinobacterium lividum]